MRRPFIAGNWKMYKTRTEAFAFAEEFKGLYGKSNVHVAVCAPFIDLDILKLAFQGTRIQVGAQNVHFENEGAFTGEISAKMLEDMEVDYCIVGHSERRQYFAETDETVNKKLLRLFHSKITPILCIGESLEQREQQKEYLIVRDQIIGALQSVTADQVSRLVVAYEPVWAIGTGKTASPEQAEDMCGFIRSAIGVLFSEEIANQVVIQYGGSVKPSNASKIMSMPNIDGALVGGASLTAKDFMEIINY